MKSCVDAKKPVIHLSTSCQFLVLRVVEHVAVLLSGPALRGQCALASLRPQIADGIHASDVMCI